jgi:hypothetical protein
VHTVDRRLLFGRSRVLLHSCLTSCCQNSLPSEQSTVIYRLYVYMFILFEHDAAVSRSTCSVRRSSRTSIALREWGPGSWRRHEGIAKPHEARNEAVPSDSAKAHSFASCGAST